MTETADSRPLNCTCGWWTEFNNDGEWGGSISFPSPTCPSWPHAEKFLTPRQRPDKVEPMTKRTVYLANPDIYESDLRNVVALMDTLTPLLIHTEGDLQAESVEITVGSKNGYVVGTLVMDDEQWVFTPRNESDVEAKIELVTDDAFTS